MSFNAHLRTIAWHNMHRLSYRVAHLLSSLLFGDELATEIEHTAYDNDIDHFKHMTNRCKHSKCEYEHVLKRHPSRRVLFFLTGLFHSYFCATCASQLLFGIGLMSNEVKADLGSASALSIHKQSKSGIGTGVIRRRH